MDLSQHKVDVYCKLLQVSDFRHTSQHCSLTHTTRGESSWEEIVSSARVWTNQAAALGAADVTSWVWQFPIWCKRFRDHRFNKTGRGKSGAPCGESHAWVTRTHLLLRREQKFSNCWNSVATTLGNFSKNCSRGVKPLWIKPADAGSVDTVKATLQWSGQWETETGSRIMVHASWSQALEHLCRRESIDIQVEQSVEQFKMLFM